MLFFFRAVYDGNFLCSGTENRLDDCGACHEDGAEEFENSPVLLIDCQPKGKFMTATIADSDWL
jgi:hypothetical protein